ncbi:MAG TPA: Shedu immune nuclease family protein [Candidatus Acidoferrum sp.]|jgi:hypothetical protein|nr:Shedu immune nuclease family protein [Candidatus Acidoferrum sp.]
MEKFTVARTSSTSADVVNDIVLSETSTTRRIFRAKFVRRPNEQEWMVKGSLICQRKSSNHAWEDARDIKLSELRAGDGVAVNLDSVQTANLIEGLDSLEAIASAKGIKWGKRELVVADPSRVIEVNDTNRKRVIEQLIARRYTQDVWDAIAETDPDLATRLSRSRIQDNRQVALNIFKQHLDSLDWSEPQWEEFFWEHQWIFGYGLRYQFLGLEKRQANYGGESYQGTGKQRGEFLARTSGHDSFTVVVEIKKPQTQLFAEREQKYRSGVPIFSTELIGGVSQAQVNSRTWDTEGSQRSGDRELLEPRGIFTIAPLSILVKGSTTQFEKDYRRRSFELFRRNVHNPEILTFDELFARAEYIVDAGAGAPAPAATDEEASFDALTDEDMPFFDSPEDSEE